MQITKIHASSFSLVPYSQVQAHSTWDEVQVEGKGGGLELHHLHTISIPFTFGMSLICELYITVEKERGKKKKKA